MNGDVTQLLERWGRGDRDALEELMPLVYDELRKLARRYLRMERADHTLQSTALAHEGYRDFAADMPIRLPAARARRRSVTPAATSSLLPRVSSAAG